MTTTPMCEQFWSHRRFLIQQAVERRRISILDLQAEPEQPQRVPGFRGDDVEPEVWAVESYLE